MLRCKQCNGVLLPVDYEMLGGDIVPAWKCHTCQLVQGSEIMCEVVAKTSYMRGTMTLAERLEVGLREEVETDERREENDGRSPS